MLADECHIMIHFCQTGIDFWGKKKHCLVWWISTDCVTWRLQGQNLARTTCSYLSRVKHYVVCWCSLSTLRFDMPFYLILSNVTSRFQKLLVLMMPYRVVGLTYHINKVYLLAHLQFTQGWNGGGRLGVFSRSETLWQLCTQSSKLQKKNNVPVTSQNLQGVADHICVPMKLCNRPNVST